MRKGLRLIQGSTYKDKRGRLFLITGVWYKKESPVSFDIELQETGRKWNIPCSKIYEKVDSGEIEIDKFRFSYLGL